MPWNEDGPGDKADGAGKPSGEQPKNQPANPWAQPPATDGRPSRPRIVPGTGRGDGGGGGGKGGGNPWGPGGGGRPPGGPPDFSRLIGQLQDFLRELIPGGGGQGGGGNGGGGGSGGRLPIPGTWPPRRLIGIGIAAIVLIWLASGIYRVQPDEQGVVLRFGAYSTTTFPGLNYHLPWPFETVDRPVVTRINRTEIGYRSTASSQGLGNTTQSEVPAESLMLTGDENIIDIHFTVFWRIADARKFLFDTRNPVRLVKAVAESSMREVIGRTPIQPALTTLRPKIEGDVLAQTQQILSRYGAGIEVLQVQLQKVDPPAEVIESFLDVQRANTDAERMINDADTYRNSIVPVARGTSARLIAEADADRQASIAQAKGETKRFLSVLAAYRTAKDITVKRMYLQTMQEILSEEPAVIVDPKLGSVLPLLRLDGAAAPATPKSPPASPAATATPPASPTAPATQGASQ